MKYDIIIIGDRMNEVLEREEIETDDTSIQDIDLSRLKSAILQFYGTAIFGVNPIARMDYDRVNSIDDPEELIREAIKVGIDVTEYIKTKTRPF